MSTQGIHIRHDGLEVLRPVLQAWIDCTQQYVALFEGNDLPYWYNERANVGVLSAAAWKAGMVSLEEFQSMKYPVPSDADMPPHAVQEHQKGRCDLYLADTVHEFFIEAKVIYPSLAKTSDCFATGLARIECDPRNVSDGSYHLAALFCAPYAAAKASSQDIAQHLACAQALDMDAHAWVACAQAQQAHSHNGRYYPLVSVFLKVMQSPSNP